MDSGHVRTVRFHDPLQRPRGALPPGGRLPVLRQRHHQPSRRHPTRVGSIDAAIAVASFGGCTAAVAVAAAVVAAAARLA